MTIYSSTTLAELLDELEMGSPHMGAAIRGRVTELQDELEVARDNPDPDWDACPNCEENEAAAKDLATRADELAARVDELEAELKGAKAVQP